MSISRCLASTAAVVALGTLAACGGGGGGDGGGGGGGSVPLSYSGNSNPAAITVSNAGAITANVVSAGDTSSAVPTASLSATPAAQVDGMIDIGRRLHRSVRGSLAQPLRTGAPRQATLAIAIDEPLDCDSGSGRIFGTVNDNGTGTVSVQFNSCRIDATTSNGSATLRIDAFDPFFFGFTDFTFSFTRLTLSGAVAADLTGSFRSRLDIPTRSETITENVVALLAQRHHDQVREPGLRRRLQRSLLAVLLRRIRERARVPFDPWLG